MDPNRRGEIALKLVKYFVARRSLHLAPEAMRELGNVAKTIDIPLEELKVFLKPIAEELVQEFFTAKSDEPAKDEGSHKEDTPPADKSAGSEGTAG